MVLYFPVASRRPNKSSVWNLVAITTTARPKPRHHIADHPVIDLAAIVLIQGVFAIGERIVNQYKIRPIACYGAGDAQRKQRAACRERPAATRLAIGRERNAKLGGIFVDEVADPTRKPFAKLLGVATAQHMVGWVISKVPRGHPHRAYFTFGRTWRARNQQTVQLAATNLLQVFHDIEMVGARLLSCRAGKFSKRTSNTLPFLQLLEG